MRSPFPGMDPYLEDPAFWPDFHPTFLVCLREAIADMLPEPYEARLNERVKLIQMSEEIIQLIYPDVGVTDGSGIRRAGTIAAGASATALLEPVVLPHEPLEEVRETRIEILHRPERDLVTVVEVLSPWNKTGEGFIEYRAKRKAILQQPVHLVELDLLLGGKRLPMGRPLPEGDYYAYVSRNEDRPNGEICSWLVRDPLPYVPIPLRAPDPDLAIDLQQVFQVTFERGRYGRSLRYGEAPPAKMSEADAAWVIDRGISTASPRPV
jgi:hypothetical protein